MSAIYLNGQVRRHTVGSMWVMDLLIVFSFFWCVSVSASPPPASVLSFSVMLTMVTNSSLPGCVIEGVGAVNDA